MANINLKIKGQVIFPPGLSMAVGKFIVGIAKAADNNENLLPIPDAPTKRGETSKYPGDFLVDPPGTPGPNQEMVFNFDVTVSANITLPASVYIVFPATFETDTKKIVVLESTDTPVYQINNTDQIIIDPIKYKLSYKPISGEVKRPFGGNSFVGLPDVPVTLLDKGLTELDQTITDALGSFSFAPSQASTFERFYLRFPEEFTSLGETLQLAKNEIEIRTQAGFAYVLPAVIYALSTAVVSGRITDGEKGIVDVPVTLVDTSTMRALGPFNTSGSGYFEARNLRPAIYKISYPSPFRNLRTGDVWELVDDDQAVQTISVKSGEMKQAQVVIYQHEEHKIVWTVESGGLPAEGVLVEVFENLGPNNRVFVDQKRSDFQGTVEFKLVKPGQYLVRVCSDESQALGVYERPVEVHSTFRGKTNIPSRPQSGAPAQTSPAAQQVDSDIKEAVVDSQAYPILTEPVSTTGALGPVPGGAGRLGGGIGLPLAATVESALRDVLSWRPKSTDSRGFLSALRQSFDLKNREGHVEYSWTPRSYAATVQDDLGAVTGAQASIYARAKAALDQSIPLLEGLYPLITTTLESDIEAARAIVRSQITQLVDELGTVGGPRVPRVDELFAFLLGAKPNTDPELVGGSLRTLGDRLGMQRKFVNTIEEEQNYTNYLILIDYVYTLDISWKNQAKYFNRVANGSEPFLGTQLVLFSQALTAVAEAVQRTYFAMDSVFLGPSERQTISLEFRSGISLPVVPGDDDMNQKNGTYQFGPDDTPMFVSELLDWIERIASLEGPRLIQDAGKDGVIAFFPTINRLRKLVHGAMTTNAGGVQNPNLQSMPAGYLTARVQRALEELASQLDDSARLAGQIVLRARQPRAELSNPDLTNSLINALQDPVVVNMILQMTQAAQTTPPPSSPPGGPGLNPFVTRASVATQIFEARTNGGQH